MKPALFTYHRPTTLEEVFGVFGSVDDLDDAKVLAGGQSLMPMLALRLAQPAHLIDINAIGTEYESIEEADGFIRVGALLRQRSAERSPIVARRCPLLAQAMSYVAHPAIRNRGTIGGSLAHADPAAELPAVALALDALLTVRRPSGTRSIPARDFFHGFLTTALQPDEILVSVDFPDLPPRSGTAFVEVSRRHGDFAMVAAAASVTVDGDRIVDARLALAGVAGAAIRAVAVEQSLRDAPANVAVLLDAARLATADLRPPADTHASSAYRRHVATVVAARALTAAFERIPERPSDAAS
jgi:carbon-monoxide dehydrogenase medium subunit